MVPGAFVYLMRKPGDTALILETRPEVYYIIDELCSIFGRSNEVVTILYLTLPPTPA